jgi:hypothetical protein
LELKERIVRVLHVRAVHLQAALLRPDRIVARIEETTIGPTVIGLMRLQSLRAVVVAELHHRVAAVVGLTQPQELQLPAPSADRGFEHRIIRVARSLRRT